MEANFVKADSSNLPKVDSAMITAFIASNSDYVSAEIRGVKNKRYVAEYMANFKFYIFYRS